MLDNLSYRLDQNGPYNTVYAAKSIPFSSISPDATYANAKVIPSGVQQNLQTPTVESWNLKIERKLFANTTLGVGYVGSHGYHELLSLDANLPTPTICPASPCSAGYPAGTLYYPPSAALANNAVWNTTHWFSEGISSYNGLEVDVNHLASAEICPLRCATPFSVTKGFLISFSPEATIRWIRELGEYRCPARGSSHLHHQELVPSHWRPGV